mgnify:CR=1 FL=1
MKLRRILSEQKVDTLDNAARLAYDYSLTHKVAFVPKPHTQQYSSDKKLFQSYGNTITPRTGTPGTSLSRNQASGNSADRQTWLNVECTYCKKIGHLKSGCPKLKRMQQLIESIKPTGLTSLRSHSHKSCVGNNATLEVTKSQSDSVMEIFELLCLKVYIICW